MALYESLIKIYGKLPEESKYRKNVAKRVMHLTTSRRMADSNRIKGVTSWLGQWTNNQWHHLLSRPRNQQPHMDLHVLDKSVFLYYTNLKKDKNMEMQAGYCWQSSCYH
jgi:hypothetical protein